MTNDNHCCRICDKDYDLHVHHIDYERTNNSYSNLVTLCSSCHRAVHLENYKPCNYPDHPIPWEKSSRDDDYDELNQEYNW